MCLLRTQGIGANQDTGFSNGTGIVCSGLLSANSSIPNWMKNISSSMSDIIIGGKYLFATGIHTKFAYSTNSRYMFPTLGGTWRWFNKSTTSFGDLFGASFKQYVAGDARASLGKVFGSIGKTAGLMGVLNFGFNLYENNWQVDKAMLIDTAIDTAISVGSYYAAVGVMSLASAGILALGLAIPGGFVVVGVIGLSLLFEWGIRELTGYKD